MKSRRPALSRSAQRLLLALQADAPPPAADSPDAAALIAVDLAARGSDGRLVLTAAGRAHLARMAAGKEDGIDPFLAQHLALGHDIQDGVAVIVDEGESPLIWLARRKGRDGRPLIEPVELMAGERLRADFTMAQMTPRITANWSASIGQSRRDGSGGAGAMTDAVLAARQRVTHALDAVGPEMAGLLLDVCCFLKRLEDTERERRWPPRTAKVVLQLGLVRLGRHYGYAAAVSGTGAMLRGWTAPDAA